MIWRYFRFSFEENTFLDIWDRLSIFEENIFLTCETGWVVSFEENNFLDLWDRLSGLIRRIVYYYIEDIIC